MELNDELNHIQSEIVKLDRSKVPTGILSIPSVNEIDEQNTQTKSDGNSMSYFDFQKNIAGLKFGMIDHSFRLTDYYDLIKNRSDEAVEMSVLHIKFNRVDESSNIKIQNLQTSEAFDSLELAAILDGSSMETATLFACLPLRDRVADGSVVEVKFNSDLFFDNTDEGEPIIEFDAGDGKGYRTVQVDSSVVVNYSEKGMKQLRINVHYGVQIFESVSTLEVIQVNLPQPDEDYELTARHYYKGTWARGKVKVYYADKDKRLQKPLYFWTGFDTGTSQTTILSTPFDMMGTNGAELFSYNYEQFLRMALDNGYDIVTLEWGNSRDYIQNNGFLAATMIQRINQQYPSAAGGVIVTGSMGGLIARWTTVYMEVEEGRRLYGAHKLAKVITLDTPHEGAVMPLAMQYAVDYMAEKIPFGWGEPAREGRRVIQSPAASQMLVQQFYSNWVHQDEPRANPEREIFLRYWKDWKPYPTELEMYAVSNGSKLGEGQMNEERSATLQPGGLLLSGKYRWIVDVIWIEPLNALPNYQERNVNGLDVLKIGYLTTNGVVAKVKKTLPYDSCPGGNWDFLSAIGNQMNVDVKMPFKRTSFIPALSSVGLVGNDLYRTIDMNNPGPFKAIYVPDRNEPHASLNNRNIPWMLRVLGIIN